jgi:putative restriction endonuclease
MALIEDSISRWRRALLHLVARRTARHGDLRIFRVSLLDAYGRACAVPQEHSLPVLEAAHIRSFATGGPHDVRNGLTRRTDLHRLFDRGHATVDENHRFIVSRRLMQDFGNGRSCRDLDGRPLTLPPDASLRPAAAALAWHRGHVFLG